MTITAIHFIILAAGLIVGYVLNLLIAQGKKDRTTAFAKEQVHFFQAQNEELKREKEALQKSAIESSDRIARLESERDNLKKMIELHESDIKEMNATFQKEFENLANKIFEEKSQKFALQNKTNLDQILHPLKERMADFQKKVEETHASNLKENSSLRQELKHLKDMSLQMSEKAENLTNALTNDNKSQGNWGEVILESILESSGLERDRNYFLQKRFTSNEGKILQPDVMIKLPDDKWVAIDSKVSLNAYRDYVNSEQESAQKEALKKHMASIRSHFKGLSGKRYEELSQGKNLDFILMFVPIEPAYLMALHGDQSLFNEAYERGVVMVSPSTLIASLKIIASTWKHEYQNKNTQAIAERGKLLLDKFSGFIESFEQIGLHISRTDKAYQDGLKKLSEGNGSLISQAKKLEELGIKSKRNIELSTAKNETR